MSWQLSRLHHIGLTVRDIEESIEFYTNVLGMELVGRRPHVQTDYVAKQTGYDDVALNVASFRISPDSEQTLEVVQYMNHEGGAVSPSTNQSGSAHFCILVDDLRASYQDLLAKGVKFKSDPVTITTGPNEGGLVVYFYSPDGHTFEMFQPAVKEVDV